MVEGASQQSAAAAGAGPLVGAVLSGRFRLLRLLGEGGMGAVYEAESARGEGRRAIKLLHPEFVRDPEVVGRFLNEAHAAQSLRHPNVAQIHESQKAEDGTPYLVMELLVGQPLLAWVASGQPVPPAQAIPVVLQILSALTAAHAGGIVHRDLKPENVFLTNDPSSPGGMGVKVLDFGIAKVMDAAGGFGNKTRTGALIGTPAYMSPEQIRNAKGVDPRSDLWSVGVMLYELLTGSQPFQSTNEYMRLQVVLTQDFAPVDRALPQLAPFQPFFQRALAKKPEERFQSAGEMARDLQALLASLTGGGAGRGAQTTNKGTQQMDAVQALGQHHPGSHPGSSQSPQAARAGHVPTAHSVPHGPSTAQSYAAAASAQAFALQPAAVGGGDARGSFAPQSAPGGLPHGSGSPTHISQQRPLGVPTISQPPPRIDVVDAPRSRGVPVWVLAVACALCLGVGFVVGLLVGG